jgi:hypothetical protein
MERIRIPGQARRFNNIHRVYDVRPATFGLQRFGEYSITTRRFALPRDSRESGKIHEKRTVVFAPGFGRRYNDVARCTAIAFGTHFSTKDRLQMIQFRLCFHDFPCRLNRVLLIKAG